MNELALFAGAGGGILGSHILGWRTICAVEWEPYAASVLVQRQNDGILPPFPIWDDVQTFDGRPWRGIVDVVSGGFPCQDISVAGKGAGIDGARSSMWKHMARIINEVYPTFTFIENSPMLRTRGLGVVLQDLAKMGYDAQWGVFSASQVGASHKRDRMWIVGFNPNSSNARRVKKPTRTDLYSPFRETEKSKQERIKREFELGAVDVAQRFSSYCDALRTLHGMADRVDRLKALGNGQVPAVAASAWNRLSSLII